MQFSHELTDRQSARVLERAIRERVAIRLDPHYSSGLDPFKVQLLSDEPEMLAFRILDDSSQAGQGLIPGQYCQAQFSLAEAAYLLNVYVVDIDPAERILRTGRPKLVQILERRKFVRCQVAPSVAVAVRRLGKADGESATLFNIGGGGLAFRIGKSRAEQIAIGDVLETQFELAGLPNRLELSVEVCNKTLASDNESVIIGAQFRETGDDARLGELDELRRYLAMQQQSSLVR